MILRQRDTSASGVADHEHHHARRRTALPGPAPTSEPGRHRTARRRAASYRAVFAIREFRTLWWAQVVSYLGDQIAQVAIAVLVYSRTGSPLLTRDVSLIFRHPAARTLVLFGWLAGFVVVPEGLAAPYARALGGGPLTVGLLMCAMPAGIVAGALVIGRLSRPDERLRMIGVLAMLSCAPLAASLLRPSLPLHHCSSCFSCWLAWAAPTNWQPPGHSSRQCQPVSGPGVRRCAIRTADRAGRRHPARGSGRPVDQPACCCRGRRAARRAGGGRAGRRMGPPPQPPGRAGRRAPRPRGSTRRAAPGYAARERPGGGNLRNAAERYGVASPAVPAGRAAGLARSRPPGGPRP
jgi:hypothetical protein